MNKDIDETIVTALLDTETGEIQYVRTAPVVIVIDINVFGVTNDQMAKLNSEANQIKIDEFRNISSQKKRTKYLEQAVAEATDGILGNHDGRRNRDGQGEQSLIEYIHLN